MVARRQTPSPSHRPVVTVAAEHGAAGDLVAQRVADALSVPFLDRALPASLARVAEREGVGRAEADRRVRAHDRARKEYLRPVFGLNADGRALYHLIVDTVALGINASVELVLAASRARTRQLRKES